METTWARFERFATELTKELGSVWRDGAWTSPATRKPRVGVTDVHLHVRMDHETSEAYFALYDGHHDEQPWDCFCSLPDEACVRTHDARFGQMLQTMSVCVRAQGRTALVITLECRPQLHDVTQRIDWLQLRWTLGRGTRSVSRARRRGGARVARGAEAHPPPAHGAAAGAALALARPRRRACAVEEAPDRVRLKKEWPWTVSNLFLCASTSVLCHDILSMRGRTLPRRLRQMRRV